MKKNGSICGNEDRLSYISSYADAHTPVIAPLSTPTLTKVVGGFSDKLLTGVVRAWDTREETEMLGDKPFEGKKIITVTAAVNTAMWNHPTTKRQIRGLEEQWRACDGNGDWHDDRR